jgi:CheY-like chemotaxis protein
MKHKILVIEDEIEMRNVIKDILEMNDFSVVLCEDGEKGIEAAKQEFPDLILCDISMPGKDGFEVLTEIRAIESIQSIPFIFLTGKSGRSDFRQGMNLSADDYLTKPFRKTELLEAINVRLARTKQIYNSQSLKLKDIEENMKAFLEGKNDPRINELESLVEKLKTTIDEKKSQIQNYAFINSHLLRGPVANILASLELAKQNPDNHTDTLQDIGKSTEKLDDVIKRLNEVLEHNQQNEFHLRESKKQEIKNVLFVDDDEMQLKITSMIMRKNFPDKIVTAFSNPKEALEIIINGERADKVFLDIFMPEMNGWGFLEELEKRNIFLDVSIVSSSIDKEDIERSKTFRSVTSYISKPISKEKIAEVLG